jgi:hypothetical protein
MRKKKNHFSNLAKDIFPKFEQVDKGTRNDRGISFE